MGILLSVFFSGCTHKKNSPLEEVLKLAGSNRHELERVIKHYSKDPADSLKLKAAEFLILNMPGKYSEDTRLLGRCSNRKFTVEQSSDKQKVLDTYRLRIEAKDDLKYITAEYLISNIDLAFQVWNDKPWGKYISFDTFAKKFSRTGLKEPLEN